MTDDRAASLRRELADLQDAYGRLTGETLPALFDLTTERGLWAALRLSYAIVGAAREELAVLTVEVSKLEAAQPGLRADVGWNQPRLKAMLAYLKLLRQGSTGANGA